ncbi:MAG: methyltransferase [Cloacibacterium sp.]|jgi:tRNA1Val (adenine37-N6)-methyltransferase|nr:methyltransferase [Cloacibacterium sp.]
MKPFCFKKFTIQQSPEVFRVGTDGVLLGVLCSVEKAKRILEVGTGTGLISLMLAQRNPNASILALDIDEKAVHLAHKNFENSPFKNRLSAEHRDYKTFSTEERFDIIVSNPPYFEEIPYTQKDVLARQQVELNFEELINSSARCLSEKGIFSVVIPIFSEAIFTDICRSKGLFLTRKTNIKGIKDGTVKRLILEFSFQPKSLVEDELTLESSPRVYSQQYLDLTHDFHIFKTP